MENMNVTQEMINSFLHTSKLDFEVAMMPQHIQGRPIIVDDVITGYEPNIKTGFCPVRTDTYKPLSLGGLSEGFTPIQNRDAFRVLRELSGVHNIELKNGGMWGGGAGVFAQVSLGDMDIGGGDKVGKFLSIVNSHDGSRAMNILITPYRFFCANQIAKAVNTAQKQEGKFLSVRHNASASDRMEDLIKSVKIADEVFTQSEDIYRKLTTMKITDIHVDEMIKRLFPLNTELGQRAQTIRKNTLDAFEKRFNSADGGRIQRDTAWNLYNSIQGTYQHDSRSSDSKIKSILMGTIADQSANALSTVLEIASSEHIPQSVLSEIDAMTM